MKTKKPTKEQLREKHGVPSMSDTLMRDITRAADSNHFKHDPGSISDFGAKRLKRMGYLEASRKITMTSGLLWQATKACYDMAVKIKAMKQEYLELRKEAKSGPVS